MLLDGGRGGGGRIAVLIDAVGGGVRVVVIGIGLHQGIDGGLVLGGDHITLVFGMIVIDPRIHRIGQRFQAQPPLVDLIVIRGPAGIVVGIDADDGLAVGD